jgi:hypothetical protein
MKKVIPTVILLAVVAAAAFVVFKTVVVHEARAAQLVPAETILFAQIPDVGTTARRLPKTALWQIVEEPEMQQFLEKAQQQNPLKAQWDRISGRLMKVVPRECFAAITSIDGTIPTFVAGFAFTGRQQDAEALIAEWRVELRKAWPAGKADLANYGKREIETFTDKDFTLAEVFCDGWYFIANNRELLERTIDRLDGKGDAAKSSLATNDVYKQAIAPLPAAPDTLLVAQLGTVMDRLTALLVAAGQKADPKEIDELRKMKAIAASTKFDGAQCRDTIFVLRPGSASEPSLERHALALSSPATLLYYAMALPLKVDLSEQSVPFLALVPGWDLLSKALAGKNLALADFPKAFGPEFGSLVDWPAGATAPSFQLALDIRDAAKAAAFVDVLTGGSFGNPAWVKTEKDGVALLSPPADEVALAAPTIALTDKFLVFALDAETVTNGLAQLKGGQPRLDAGAAYTAAAKSVTQPTSGFAYIDLPTLFERAYAVFRPLLAMSLAFSPEAGQVFDAGKLPPAATITRHLGPIVYSQATSERGTLIESTGPLTFNQLLIGGAAGAITAALPTIQAALTSGALLDPGQLLQTLGGPGAASGNLGTPEPVEPNSPQPEPPPVVEPVPDSLPAR